MPDYQDIKKQLQQYVTSEEIAGANIIIRKKGEIALEESIGYAQPEREQPVDTKTIFSLCSMSKPVTALAVMMLAESGKIKLEDSISKYITVYQGTDKEKVKIIHLLNHSSGFGMFGKNGMIQGIRLSKATDRLADRVDRWKEIPLDFDPGTAAGYSPCIGFDVLGRIIEVVSEMELPEYLQQFIFTPLGIKDMTFILNDEQKERGSVVFHNKKISLDNPVPAELGNMDDYTNASLAGYYSGAAGLYGTAGDYDKIARVFINDGIYKETRLLKEETIKWMHTPNNHLFVKPEVVWGLGMNIFGNPEKTGIWLHEGSYGWSGAYGTHFFVDPKAELSCVLMLNVDNIGGSESYISRAVEKLIWDCNKL